MGLTAAKEVEVGTDSERVGQDFRRYFAVVPATTAALREETYRIRYQVYVEELGWEDKAMFPDGYEKDAYDQEAVACLLKHRATGQFIGCVRLVLIPAGNPSRFPFEKAMASHDSTLDGYSRDWRDAAGEISRVAVVSQFRRRRDERHQPDSIPDDGGHTSPERRVFPHIAIGLYLGAAALGLSRGLNRVFAIMEPRLARRLRTYGIEFDAVGDPIEHHGTRIPYCLTRESFERTMTPAIRGLLETIRADLACA